MTMPTDAEIDDAIPVDGIPDRAKLNALLKRMAAAGGTGVQLVPTVPRTVNDPGQLGDMFFGDPYLYFYAAGNMWRRVFTERLPDSEGE